MKHPYDDKCECGRCRRERGRRTVQARAEHARRLAQGQLPRAARRRRAPRETDLERWAREYYETEGGIDQFNPEDR